MESEAWRDVKEYEGLYQVSNLGRVKRLKRKSLPRKCGGYVKIMAEKIIPQRIEKGNYKSAVLLKNSKIKKFYIHILVANSFIGEKPVGYETDHIDNNPKNNRADNLQYLTRKQNKMKANKRIGKRGIQKRDYGKYRSRITIDGIGTINLGEFKSKEDAYTCFYKTFKEWNGSGPWSIPA